jgi:hypothetical protein
LLINGHQINASSQFIFNIGGIAAVPEPTTWLLLLTGLFILSFALRVKRNQA